MVLNNTKLLRKAILYVYILIFIFFLVFFQKYEEKKYKLIQNVLQYIKKNIKLCESKEMLKIKMFKKSKYIQDGSDV